MAKEKRTFEPKANHEEVTVVDADGKTIRIKSGSPYETTDPVLIFQLSQLDSLKSSTPSAGKEKD
jgi:hypothetical protein